MLVHHPDVHAGQWSPRRPQLLGVLPGVGGGPADDLPHFGLPVAVQHRHAESIGETAGGERREGRSDAPDEPQRREVGHRRILGEHDHGGRRQHRRTHVVAVHQFREIPRRETRHQDHGRSGSQAEAHVVDAGIEGDRDGNQVRGGLARAPVAGAVPPQRFENSVQELEVSAVRLQNRLGRTSGPRRPGDECDIGFMV